VRGWVPGRISHCRFTSAPIWLILVWLYIPCCNAISFCKGTEKSPGSGKAMEPTKIRTKTLNSAEDLWEASINIHFLPSILSRWECHSSVPEDLFQLQDLAFVCMQSHTDSILVWKFSFLTYLHSKTLGSFSLELK